MISSSWRLLLAQCSGIIFSSICTSAWGTMWWQGLSPGLPHAKHVLSPLRYPTGPGRLWRLSLGPVWPSWPSLTQPMVSIVSNCPAEITSKRQKTLADPLCLLSFPPSFSLDNTLLGWGYPAGLLLGIPCQDGAQLLGYLQGESGFHGGPSCPGWVGSSRHSIASGISLPGLLKLRHRRWR